MRVLMVTGEYPPMTGGVSRYTHSLVKALARKVHVDVAAGVGSANATDSDVVVYPVIRKGDRGNSDRLLRLVSELRPDIVNVQYERGLYEIDSPIQIFAGTVRGSSLDKLYRECPVPVVSTIHTVYPFHEYMSYIRQRGARKAGRIGFLPQPIRVAIRARIMRQRYSLILRMVRLSREVISPAKTVRDIVNRGEVIYHGAEIEFDKQISKEELREQLGLPLDKMLLLAFGYAGFYKGFDILDSLSLPKGWKLVVKQDKHERGGEKPVQIRNATNLNLGYVDNKTLSMLFLACDAIIFPYRLVSVSGVLFDALAHGLPFVASNLEFFKEFEELGLGVTSERNTKDLSTAIEHLAQNYRRYRRSVEQFGATLRWDSVASLHIDLYSHCISPRSTAVAQ